MSYFKPWRRKIGVITLVLACLFAAVWVRSIYIVDNLVLTRSGLVYGLNSSCGALQWIKVNPTEKYRNVVGMFPKRSPFSWSSYAVSNISLSYQRPPLPTEFRWAWGGCEYYFGSKKELEKRELTITYWSIVVPLTLLSSWLLLSKPKHPKPTSDPPV